MKITIPDIKQIVSTEQLNVGDKVYRLRWCGDEEHWVPGTIVSVDSHPSVPVEVKWSDLPDVRHYSFYDFELGRDDANEWYRCVC